MHINGRRMHSGDIQPDGHRQIKTLCAKNQPACKICIQTLMYMYDPSKHHSMSMPISLILSRDPYVLTKLAHSTALPTEVNTTASSNAL